MRVRGPGWVRRLVAEHPVRQIGPVFLAGRRVPGWAVRRAPSEGAVYLRADYVARVAERGDPPRVIPCWWCRACGFLQYAWARPAACGSCGRGGLTRS